MSRTQLYRKFNALTDQTVSKFIRNIRLRKAKDLLVNQNLEVSEAAYRVGFKNLSHFSSAFKAEFGINPSKITGRDTNLTSRDK
jgi:AraC-like DNA-binding protein